MSFILDSYFQSVNLASVFFFHFRIANLVILFLLILNKKKLYVSMAYSLLTSYFL